MGKCEKFGTVLGVAPGGVPAYSSHYRSADPEEYPSRRSYRAHHDGIYTGYRYQCVEFARRWLVQTNRLTFADVHMAYEIFDLPELLSAETQTPIPVVRAANGQVGHLPVLGTVLLWQPSGYFNHTGHVAIVTHCDVEKGKIGIAEQNVTDRKWPEGAHYARELDLVLPTRGSTTTGGDPVVTIQDNYYDNTHVLGWITGEPFLPTTTNTTSQSFSQQQQQEQQQPPNLPSSTSHHHHRHHHL